MEHMVLLLSNMVMLLSVKHVAGSLIFIEPRGAVRN